MINILKPVFLLTIIAELLGSITVAVSPTSSVGKCESSGLYSDQDDCSAFYFCKNNFKYHLTCDANYMFDPVSGNCIEMNAGKCKTGLTVHFPSNFGEAKKLMESKNNVNKPQVTCYISNWNFCTSSDQLIPNKLVCNEACYASAALTATSEQLKTSCSSIVDKPKPGNGSLKLFCYYNVDWFRSGEGKFGHDDIEPSLCTHVIYAYAGFENSSLTIKPLTGWTDWDKDFKRKILTLKSKGIKVIIAVGGWDQSEDNKFSRMVSSFDSRMNFMSSLTELMFDWGFDGIEFDWEYPKCWHGNCEKGLSTDKDGFTELIKELSEPFRRRGFLIGSTISWNKNVIDAGYDLASLTKYVDWLNVLVYNIHGDWEGKTGPAAPIYGSQSISDTISHIIQKGFQPSKLMLFVSAHGTTYTLADPKQNDYGAVTRGPGKPGPSTTSGYLTFSEICDRTKRKQWNINRLNGTYAYKDDQWVSYNDVQNIKEKAKYIIDSHLGGATFWNFAMDDFKNSCGCGKFPILNALSYYLRGISINSNLQNCS